MKEVGFKIKKLRELNNIKQEEMAHRLGMSQSAYSRLESGDSKVDIPKLERIAAEFSMKLDELLSFDEKQLLNGYHHQVSGKGSLNSDQKEEVDFYRKQLEAKDKVIDYLQSEISRLQQENQRLQNNEG
jgi:transcriptional regulator with XRE-family HTH domain